MILGVIKKEKQSGMWAGRRGEFSVLRGVGKGRVNILRLWHRSLTYSLPKVFHLFAVKRRRQLLVAAFCLPIPSPLHHSKPALSLSLSLRLLFGCCWRYCYVTLSTDKSLSSPLFVSDFFSLMKLLGQYTQPISDPHILSKRFV